MTAFADVKPTTGDVANSYEYIFDLAARPTGSAEPNWVNVPDITALNPAFAAKLKDITTYAHKGSTAQAKVGDDFTLDFNILKIRDNTGEFQAEWLMLKNAADSKGEANRLLFRYYDALGASDAYQGVAAVSRGNRPSTGNDDPGFDNFALTGVGQVLPIPNPTLAPATPATGATAGTPGVFTPAGSMVPANLTALQAGSVAASPTAAWAAGEHVVLGDTSRATWDGSAWVVFA